MLVQRVGDPVVALRHHVVDDEIVDVFRALSIVTRSLLGALDLGHIVPPNGENDADGTCVGRMDS